jgi:hypothetical protein
MIKEASFEISVQKYFIRLFEKMGFNIIEIRRQTPKQHGFNIFLKFLDENECEKSLHFECMDYSNNTNWSNLIINIHEIDSLSFIPNGFVALSPKSELTNKNRHILDSIQKKISFPIEFWDTNNFIEEMFALDKYIYFCIYGSDCNLEIDENKVLQKIDAPSLSDWRFETPKFQQFL